MFDEKDLKKVLEDIEQQKIEHKKNKTKNLEKDAGCGSARNCQQTKKNPITKRRVS